MRLRICTTLAFFLGLGLVLKLWMLSGLVSSGTYARVVAVDTGLACALLVFTFFSLSNFEARLRELVRSLDVFVQGRRDHRVPTELGGYLSDLGLQINEVLALASHEPTAEFRRVVRPSRAKSVRHQPEPASKKSPLDYAETGAGEGVGPVRVVQRSDGYEVASELIPAPSPHGAVFDTEISAPVAPEDELHTEFDEPSFFDDQMDRDDDGAHCDINDTLQPEPLLEPTVPETHVNADPPYADDLERAVDFAPALSLPDEDEDADHQQDDYRQERRELYEAFVAEKRRLGEAVEGFDFEAFEDLLEDVARQLKTERGCEQVRFDIRVAAGKVALQPRMVRQKAQVS